MTTSRRASVTLSWSVIGHGCPDWRGSGFVERWVAGAVSAGVVGRMRKLAIGYDQEPVEVPNHEVADVPKLLAERFAALQGNADLRASGTEPDTWELSLSVMPSPPNQSFIGDAMLRFARVPDEGPDFSNGLWSAFRSVHSAADTRCAFLHPWKRFLTDRNRHPPIVSGSTFDSAWWGNFLSASQLQFFQREKLEGLDALGAEAVEWMPDGSLFLRLTPSIWDIVRKETRTGVDQRRMSLVRRFTDALERRKDSRQRRDR